MALLLACERKNVGKGELPFEPVDVEGRRRVVLPPEHLVVPHPAVDERRGERFVTEAGLIDRLPAELAVAQGVPCGAEVVLGPGGGLEEVRPRVDHERTRRAGRAGPAVPRLPAFDPTEANGVGAAP